MSERPPCTQKPSPNFGTHSPGRRVSCVVMHATATSGLDSPLRELCDPKTESPKDRVSAHYLIDTNGTIYQLVEENCIAWHAGYSEWAGQMFVNNFSIGIELVNQNDGKMAYPDAQLSAAAHLVAAICKDYKIMPGDVVGHRDIVAGRSPEEKAERLKLHSDPQGFPWDEFRGMVQDFSNGPVA